MNAIYYIGLDIHKKTIAYCRGSGEQWNDKCL